MLTLINLQEKIKDLPLNEALTEVNKAIETQGENPDDEILIIKAEILFSLADKKAEEENDYSYFYEIYTILNPLAERKNKEQYYPQILYMLTISLMKLDWYEDAQFYAEQYYETHHNDLEASLLLAYIYSNMNINLEKSLILINNYLASGDYLRGIPIKISIMILMKQFEEANSLIEYCEQAYPNQRILWIEKRIFYYQYQENIDKALELTDILLSETTDTQKRYALFYNVQYYLLKYKSEKETIEYIKKYIQSYPLDAFAYYALAKIVEITDIDECIELYEKTYSLDKKHHTASTLLNQYMKRDKENDAKNYFKLFETLLTDGENFHWSDIKDTMYKKYYKYDKGHCIRLLEKDLLANPNHECSYTMLGKLYECGIGVDADAERAFSYYESAYSNYKSSCGCSAVFYAYSLYFGIGTAQNQEKARTLILEVINERTNDSDRDCLYAIMAFEGNDNRFDKKHAMDLLRKDQTDACSVFLLSKYTKKESDKIKYFELFKNILEKTNQLERDYLQKYADNPNLPFIPFIRN